MPIMFLIPIWIITDLNCSFFVGVFLFIIEIQAWLTSFNSLDRCLSVLRPLKYSFKNKKSFQFSVIIFTLVAVLFLIFPIFTSSTVVFTSENQTICSPRETLASNYNKIQYLFFRVLIPFSVMIISSFLTFKIMYNNKNQISSNSDRTKEWNLFKALIAFDAFFIVFRIPFTVAIFIDGYIMFSKWYDFLLIIGLLSNVFIFVVLLVFNKIYRDLFCKHLKIKTSNRVRPAILFH